MRKLGRRPARHDVRTAHFIDFLHRPKLPRIPLSKDWDASLPEELGMFANDKYGDCGFASMAHAVQTWTATPGPSKTLTDDEVLAAYSACTGFRIDDPSSDGGVVMLDALKFWRKTGIASRKIGAFLKVDHSNLGHCRAGIALFGGLYVGANLPTLAQDPGPWIGSKGRLIGGLSPGSWGGHCMWCPSYDAKSFEFVTWGKRQTSDVQWWLNYVDEAYVCVSQDWVDEKRPAPSGFDLKKLQEFLRAL